MKRDRSWGAVVFRDDGPTRLFLLVKLASGGHWDHPKGHPEPGESPRETARREIREEGAVTVSFLEGFLSQMNWTLPSGIPKDVGYFLAERVRDTSAGGPEGEILDVAWLSYSDAMNLITYESGRKVLGDAMAFLGSAFGADKQG